MADTKKNREYEEVGPKIREAQEKSTTYILGQGYHTESRAADIRRHARSLFRLTYRRDFPPLLPYTITSDAGWGCMLRSAQMLMAYAMKRHFLGRDWRIPADIDKQRSCQEYVQIIKWFADYPGPPHYYSIHHLVQCGLRYDKLPGEWFGPSTAALALKDMAKLHRRKYGGPLEILVTQSEVIYIADVEALCTTDFNSNSPPRSIVSNSSSSLPSSPTTATSPLPATDVDETSDAMISSPISPTELPPNPESVTDPTSPQTPSTSVPLANVNEPSSFFDPLLNPPPSEQVAWKTSLVVCIPIMLGASSSTISEATISALKKTLRSQYCIGLLGGRVNHAIYFVGYRGQTLLGLDPHYVFPNPSLAEPFPPADYLSQIHVDELETLDFSRLDPSIAIAFYFRNRTEFEAFCEETKKEMERTAKEKGSCMLYSVMQTAPSYCAAWSGDDGGEDEEDNDDDEYVLI